jgi:hypothetical protein
MGACRSTASDGLVAPDGPLVLISRSSSNGGTHNRPSGMAHLVEELGGSVPEHELAHIDDYPARELQACPPRRIAPLIAEAEVMQIALHLHHESAFAIDQIYSSDPGVAAQIDLAIERSLPVLDQQLVGPGLEVALGRSVVGWSGARELAKQRHPRSAA